MSDLLSAKDWLDQGIKALAANGVSALKAEPLAKALGVSRGSFYWHFADIGAFRTAILAYWREVSAERVIADLEAAGAGEDALLLLLRRTFSSRLSLEKAVRSWATFDAEARSAVQAIDRRRVDYIDGMLRAVACSGLSAARRTLRKRARKSCIGPLSVMHWPTSHCRKRNRRRFTRSLFGSRCETDTARRCYTDGLFH